MNFKTAFSALVLAASVCAVWAADEQVYDIPKLDGITIDGKSEDWGDKGMMVDVLKDVNGAAPAPANFKAAFRLGWNDEGLLVLVWVSDDVALEPEEKVENLWKGDSIEMFMATDKGAVDHMQVVIAPGRDPNHKGIRTNVSDYRKEKKGHLTVKAASTINENGYVIECLLPWKALGIEAAEGKNVGFQFFANDVDKAGERNQLLWYPKPDAHNDTNNMYRLKLGASKAAAAPAPAPAPAKVEAAPAPAKTEAAAPKTETTAAAGGAQITMEANLKESSLRVTQAAMEDGHGLITVSAASKLKGKKIRVKDGDKKVGEGKLEAEGDAAIAKIKLDKPKEKYGPLTVTYDDEPIGTVKLQ
jgi:hypothetical protein